MLSYHRKDTTMQKLLLAATIAAFGLPAWAQPITWYTPWNNAALGPLPTSQNYCVNTAALDPPWNTPQEFLTGAAKYAKQNHVPPPQIVPMPRALAPSGGGSVEVTGPLVGTVFFFVSLDDCKADLMPNYSH
jgi:hypothetical protein